MAKPGQRRAELMASYDFRSPRLFVPVPLAPGATVPLAVAQAHYLVNVLRLKLGASILIFNGSDGEWKAHLDNSSRHRSSLVLETQTRPQPQAGNLHYLFSPLKRARLDYMVQKAVEMGASLLQPVIMRHTQAERVKHERMRANAIEAAEQCGILAVPQVMAPLTFKDAIAALSAERYLVFCDEEAAAGDPVARLRAAFGASEVGTAALAVMIGPEGGFAEEERAALLSRRQTIRIALGPRILRADTAAVAALALVQAVIGDWR